MSEQYPVGIRASDAEREQTCALLKEACVEGRLTLDEFSERIALAHSARTRDELAVIVRDLPAIPSSLDRREPTSAIVAVLSGVERRGVWNLDRATQVRAVLGGCKLDLRHAVISAEVTTIEAQVILGSLEVIVPEGVEVDLASSVFMGSKTLRTAPRPRVRSNPVIRITGLIVAGSVTVRDKPKLHERVRETIEALIDPPRTSRHV